METKLSKIVLMLLILIIVSASTIVAQETPSVATPVIGACQFSEVFQSDVWEIPGLVGSLRTKTSYRLAGSPEIVAIRLAPGHIPSKLTVLECSRSTPGRIRVRRISVRPLELWRCEVQGRVFAYAARYAVLVVSKKRAFEMLESVSAIFYDTDGAGTFTSIRYPSGTVLGALSAPEWVKREVGRVQKGKMDMPDRE